MIEFSLRWDQGLSHVTEWLEELASASDLAMEDFLTTIGRSMQQRAKNKIRNDPVSGIVYKRYNPARVVQASAPGEAPADDLGGLADSIILRNTGSLQVFVAATAAYARVLEEGGLVNNNAYIAPRPFFYISYFEAIDKAEKTLSSSFRKFL